MGNVVIDYAFTFKNYTHNLFWSNTGHSCGGGGGGWGVGVGWGLYQILLILTFKG